MTIQELHKIIQTEGSSVISQIGVSAIKQQAKSMNVMYHLRLTIFKVIFSKLMNKPYSEVQLDDIKRYLNTNIKKIFMALLTVYIDITLTIAILKNLPKILPNSLGYLIYKLNLQVAIHIAKFKSKGNPERMFAANNMLKEISETKMDLSDPVHLGAISSGKFLLSAAIAGSLNEEASKRLSLELGYGKEYFVVFNAYEFSTYVLQHTISGVSVKDSVIQRAQLVIFHGILTYLNKLGYHKTAIFVHFMNNLFGIANSEILYSNNDNMKAGTSSIIAKIQQDKQVEMQKKADLVEESINKSKNKLESKLEKGINKLFEVENDTTQKEFDSAMLDKDTTIRI